MPRKIFLWLLVLLFTGSISFPLVAQQAPVPAAPVEPPQRADEAETGVESAPQVPVTPAPAIPGRRMLPAPAAPRGDMVSLNFNRADLIEIIHILAQHLKLTYTIDPEVKGTVSIHSAEPLKKEDLLPIFHQVLRMNGAVAVRTGSLYRIMPIKDGKGVVRPAGQSKEDGFALQVVPVRFFSVAEMKKLLSPFVTPGGEIIDYPRGNFLIVVDLPSNIQRLVEIRDLIDVQVFAGTRMEIYQPRVASADELAAEMTKIMQSYASSSAQAEGFAAQFLSIPRINQLLVISHSEAAWTYARRWLERIDVVAEGPGRRIFIYPVENGKATELADVLSQALGQPSTGRREPSKTLQDLHRASPGGLGQTGSRAPTSGFGATGQPTTQAPPPLGAYAVAPVPGQPPTPALPPVTAAPRATPPSAPSVQAEEPMRIVPDPATNSLIIYGTAQEFQNIKNILKELDIIPRQVLMDVLVAEVTLDDEFKFGVEYEILRRGGDVRIAGREFRSRGGVVSGALPAIPTSGLTAFPLGLSGVIGTGNAIRAFINASKTDSRVKVLSSPSVLATDNRPARIQVGEEVPVLASQQVTATTTGVLVNNVQYRNTGVILTLIPQVNSQGLVHLQVKQEVSGVGVNNFGATGSPSFTTRDAETTAVVQDGETLVIGGIIEEKKSRGRTGIPFLMDIPVLGPFFGFTTEDVERTELVMLITPHVIRNKEEARGVTEEFKQKLSAVRAELERLKRDEEKEKIKRQEGPPPVAPKPSSYVPESEPRILPSGQGAVRPPLKNISNQSDVTPLETLKEQKPDIVRPKASIKAATPVVQMQAVVKSDDKGDEPGEAKAAALPTPAKRTIDFRKFGGADRQAERTRGVWVVQVGAFVYEKEADALATKLRNKGYDVYLTTAKVSGRIWHRVRVGHTASRKEALELQKTLEASEKLAETFIASR